jgi:cbb3-type cytochrome oxidase subunit 3
MNFLQFMGEIIYIVIFLLAVHFMAFKNRKWDERARARVR